MGHLAKQRDASFFVLFFKTCQYGVLTKLNHLDVFKYLETLLSAFTKRETPEIEAYLPWAHEIQESCKA